MTRKEFETFLKAEPFCLNVDRWLDDDTATWPGQYQVYAVQLAWEVLQEAEKRRGKGNKE